jgi:hypothetical protein
LVPDARPMPTPNATSAPQTQKQTAQSIPEGYCQFEGRVIHIIHVPERAWYLPLYDNDGIPTGQTVGDAVREARDKLSQPDGQ